jgi:hypothetical protein
VAVVTLPQGRYESRAGTTSLGWAKGWAVWPVVNCSCCCSRSRGATTNWLVGCANTRLKPQSSGLSKNFQGIFKLSVSARVENISSFIRDTVRCLLQFRSKMASQHSRTLKEGISLVQPMACKSIYLLKVWSCARGHVRLALLYRKRVDRRQTSMKDFGAVTLGSAWREKRPPLSHKPHHLRVPVGLWRSCVSGW